MNIDIIPSIVPQDPAKTIEQVNLARGFAEIMQIDIGDGICTPHSTLQSKDIPQRILEGAKFELHLMVSHPDDYVHEWMKRKPTRIIVHAEAQPSALLLQEIEHEGIEPVIGLFATSEISVLEPYMHLVQSFLFLSVNPPGGQGQQYIAEVAQKMFSFHRTHSSYTIEADGGINESTMQTAIQSGATRLVMGSALFDAPRSPSEQFQYFNQLARQYASEANV